ncbi:PREDICTED: uncharacterized protein CXorf65 homolog [Miniopterus natalensis]|uniref:uncharacterized protein CXorf65 homolog n=1 Tax=Miniopterus natalensis TaxID=291302 RepID=UPI0007A6FA7F|nr:PREDICTED: uncharacterized protein CXorf65 homolog [Miniopterus natalensis]
MFIYIKYGDNQHFIVNINCAVHRLLHYTRSKVGLAKTDTIDLCDETGTMKLFFLMKIPGDYASKFLTARNTYYVCRVARGTPGTQLANAYLAFVPLLKNPEHTLLDALRTQCDMLERSRLKMLRLQEAKKAVKIDSSVNLPSKTGEDKNARKLPRKGPFQKTRAGFLSKKGKQTKKIK